MELTQGRFVVEMLSPGVRQFDRGGKLVACRKLAELQHITAHNRRDAAQSRLWAVRFMGWLGFALRA